MKAELRARPGGGMQDGEDEIHAATTSPERVGHGSRVYVLDMKSGEEELLTLVASERVDPDAGHVSLASPVGQALLGRKAGESVVVSTPSGDRRLTVISVMPVVYRPGAPGGEGP